MKRILQLLTAVMSLSIMGTVQTWAEFSLSSDSATLAAESYPRRMVMEEATATWCGWCPQGIVAIDGLKRDFPDNFLAIAIHGNRDKMAYVDEYGLQVNSYPSAFLNRQSTSVSYSWLKRQIEKAGLTTDKMVRIDSVTYVEADETYKVYTTTRVANLLENAQLRLVYVVTEDSVGPYKQTNNFAGESDEMGGFENLPTKVEMLYSDVARFIYPSCDGLEGSVPSTLEACKDYAYVANVSANFNCDDYGKLQLTVMLYDAATNTIVNADRMPLPKRTDLDKTLTIDMGQEPGTLKEKLGNDLYKVRNLVVSGKINGDDLATLRDMVGCTDGEYVDYVDGVYSDYWDAYKNVTLYVPRDAVDKFRKHRVWGMAKEVLPVEDTEFAYLADSELDAVDEVETSSTAMPHSIYSPTGVKLNRPIKGLNIVDGKKVMVK